VFHARRTGKTADSSFCPQHLDQSARTRTIHADREFGMNTIVVTEDETRVVLDLMSSILDEVFQRSAKVLRITTAVATRRTGPN